MTEGTQTAIPSSQDNTDIILPYVTLQPDFAKACTDVAQGLHSVDTAWLSVYALNAPRASIHTKILLAQEAGRAGRSDGANVSLSLDKASAKSLRIERIAGSKNDFSVYTDSGDGQQAGPSKANRMKGSVEISQRIAMRIPRRTIGPLVKGALGVTAFDTSPTSNGLYVVGGSDGQAHVGRLYDDTQNGRQEEDSTFAATASSHGTSSDLDIETVAQQRMQQRERERLLTTKTYLKGHVGDIRSARFFPSGEVVLTTSSDFTARIFGVDGSSPRTFTGHRRAVLSSAIVERGKQVLTSSADGTTRIWDVSQGIQLGSLMSLRFSAINTISLGRKSEDGQRSADDILITGLSNGTIEAHDLRSRQVVFRAAPSLFPSGAGPQASDSWKQAMTGGIEALDFSPASHLLVAGCTNGVVVAHDTRMLSTQHSDEVEVPEGQNMLASWRRNGATINDVVLTPESSSQVLVATADGAPYLADIGIGNVTRSADPYPYPQVIDEYTSWDVDNVSCCGVDARGRTWLAGAEGKVRMYY